MRIQQLLAPASLLVYVCSGAASTQPVQSLDAPDKPPLPNLIDVLSSSADHTIFVRLLQRTRLIPTLINLQEFGDGRGLTIFAPTDEAIIRKEKEERDERLAFGIVTQASKMSPYYNDNVEKARTQWEWAVKYAADSDDNHSDVEENLPIWTRDGTSIGNINSLLRQQLLYHMLNYTLDLNTTKYSDEQKDRPKPKMLTTLHLPSRRLLHEPARRGPIPHAPRPGHEDDGNLLNGEGQKIRICLPNDAQSVLLGTDSNCDGGAPLVGVDRRSDKGIVYSIDGVISLPPDLATVIRSHPRLQHLVNFTESSSLQSLAETAHSTFFLPIAEAFEALSQIERSYITSELSLAQQDRFKLLGEHMSGIGLGAGRVAYADRIRKGGCTNLTTIFGGQVSVRVDENGWLTLAQDARVIEEDILTENGVVHIVDKLLLPYGDLGLTVEKTLLTLNATRFVSMMHSANLQHYIDANPHDIDDPENKALPWTFMVPRDDVVAGWLKERWPQYLESLDEGSKLVNLLKYHIAPDKLTPQNLTDGMLIGTELRNWRLRDARQRIVVGVDEENGEADTRKGNGDVGFGDANVIAEPVTVGPAIIYLISKVLEPPSNPIQTAVSFLSLSTFVAAVFSAELDKPIKRAPAVTYVVPHNDAFSALGLAMPYLLLDQQEPRRELRSVVEYHAIDRIVYMQDFASGSHRYPTLEGSSIWAGREGNGTVEVRRGTGGRNARVLKGDLLTSTGVLHEIDQVELPPTLDLTIAKLMRGAKANTMRDLINKAGYGWLLNGTKPSMEQATEFARMLKGKFPDHDNKKKRKQEKRHKKRHELFDDAMQSYVVLCPTDAAFTRINLTRLYNDEDALKRLVQLHIVPSPADEVLPGGTNDQLPLSLKDTSIFATLLDSSLGGLSGYGKVAFRKLAKDETLRSRKRPKPLRASREDDDSDLGWLVGIADTRGTDGKKYSARILSFGRESLSADRYKKRADEAVEAFKKGKRGRMPEWNSQNIGGILTIDTVLQPYVPGWFYRWGWIVVTSLAILLALAGVGAGLWKWYKRDSRIRLPEALEGEEE